MDEIQDALNYISADERDICVKIGMAIKTECGDAGYSLWDNWLQSGAGYNQKDMLSVWRSITQGAGVTIASLFHLAIQNGYTKSNSSGLSPVKTNKPKPKPEIKPNFHAIQAIKNVVSDMQYFDKYKVTDYLNNRGLDVELPSDIGFIEKCPDGSVFREAMISLIKNVKGEVVNIHRTFIKDEYKISGVSKKIMTSPLPGAISGCAVRLTQGKSDTVYLTEGIETGFAVYQMLRDKNPTVWACISANGMANIQLPKQYKMVYLMADKDISRAGIRAAQQAKVRLEGENRTVYIAIPNQPIPTGKKSVDWLDILQWSTCR